MLREPYGSRDKILPCVHCNCYAFSSKVTYILILDYATCEIMRYLVSFLIWIHVLVFLKLKGTFLLVLMTIIKEWEAPRTQKHNREKPDEWAFVLVDEIRKTSKETAQLCTAISFEYLPHLTLHSPDIKTGPSGFPNIMKFWVNSVYLCGGWFCFLIRSALHFFVEVYRSLIFYILFSYFSLHCYLSPVSLLLLIMECLGPGR